MTGIGDALARATVKQALRDNHLERQRITSELEASKGRCGALIKRARQLEVSIDDIVEASGYSRERVYEFIRGRMPRATSGRPKITTEGADPHEHDRSDVH